ncbi:hypothetical protein B0O80DRAFT_458417 [Mortierella sp. GBAus27b]|nr:hypothetical protein B0O80DRAFT_458417 [Mortierella sp. GBAus27b]
MQQQNNTNVGQSPGPSTRVCSNAGTSSQKAHPRGTSKRTHEQMDNDPSQNAQVTRKKRVQFALPCDEEQRRAKQEPRSTTGNNNPVSSHSAPSLSNSQAPTTECPPGNSTVDQSLLSQRVPWEEWWAIASQRMAEHPEEAARWRQDAEAAETMVPHWCPREEWTNWVWDDSLNQYRPVVPGERLPTGAYWTPLHGRKFWKQNHDGVWTTDRLDRLTSAETHEEPSSGPYHDVTPQPRKYQQAEQSRAKGKARAISPTPPGVIVHAIEDDEPSEVSVQPETPQTKAAATPRAATKSAAGSSTSPVPPPMAPWEPAAWKRIREHPIESARWWAEANAAGTRVPYWCPREEWGNWIHDDTINNFRPVVPGEKLPHGAYWTPASQRRKWRRYESVWKTADLLKWERTPQYARLFEEPLPYQRIGSQEFESPLPSPRSPTPDPTPDMAPLYNTWVPKPQRNNNAAAPRSASSTTVDTTNGSSAVLPSSEPLSILVGTSVLRASVVPPSASQPTPSKVSGQQLPPRQKKKKQKPTKPKVHQSWIDARKPLAVEVQGLLCLDPTERQVAQAWFKNWIATERRRPYRPSFPEQEAVWWPAALERMIDHWPSSRDWVEDAADTGTHCPYWVPHWEWPNWIHDTVRNIHRPLSDFVDPNRLREEAPYWVPWSQRRHWMDCGYTPRLWISRNVVTRRENRKREAANMAAGHYYVSPGLARWKECEAERQQIRERLLAHWESKGSE